MKILIVEDEQKTASYLKKGLTEHDYIVDVCHDGIDGLWQATSNTYDLLILDVMLPGRDGWSVLKELREKHKDMLVLLLTAKDSLQDRVKGLDLGADAYLVKPFAFTELLAQIRSLLRRTPGRQPERYAVADLALDLVKRTAYRGTTRLDLTRKEFMLLTFLTRRAGEVLSRTLISEQVWDMSFDCGTNVVDVHIRRLRAKVDDPFEVKLIHTVRCMGYVLRANGGDKDGD